MTWNEYWKRIQVFWDVMMYWWMSGSWYTEGPGGTVNILRDHSFGHSKQKFHIYMWPIPNGFQGRAVSLYSCLVLSPNIVLPSCYTAPYESMWAISWPFPSSLGSSALKKMRWTFETHGTYHPVTHYYIPEYLKFKFYKYRKMKLSLCSPWRRIVEWGY
jgi:hypothetical protein